MARYLIPRQTGLRHELERDLSYDDKARSQRPLDLWMHPQNRDRQGLAVVISQSRVCRQILEARCPRACSH